MSDDTEAPAWTVAPDYAPAVTALHRYVCMRGGRASGKSHAAATIVLARMLERTIGVMVVRATAAALVDSFAALLLQKARELRVDHLFTFTRDRITAIESQSTCVFLGTNSDPNKARSYEGIELVVGEESAYISDESFAVLTPTIRADRAQFLLLYNPVSGDSYVERLAASGRPDVLVLDGSVYTNPYASAAIKAEAAAMAAADPDMHRHVWLGQTWDSAGRLIYGGKVVVEPIDESTLADAQTAVGVDWGFSDATVCALVAYRESDRTLFVVREVYAPHVDMNNLPAMLDSAIPESRMLKIACDAADPGRVAMLKTAGFSRAESAPKWPWSVWSGIAALRSLDRIVISPDAPNCARDFQRYAWKFRNGKATQEPEHEYSHGPDAVRYAAHALGLVSKTGSTLPAFRRLGAIARETQAAARRDAPITFGLVSRPAPAPASPAPVLTGVKLELYNRLRERFARSQTENANAQ